MQGPPEPIQQQQAGQPSVAAETVSAPSWGAWRYAEKRIDLTVEHLQPKN